MSITNASRKALYKKRLASFISEMSFFLHEYIYFHCIVDRNLAIKLNELRKSESPETIKIAIHKLLIEHSNKN